MASDTSGAMARDSGGFVPVPTQRVSLTHVVFMVSVHLGAVAAAWHFYWTGVGLMLAFYVVTGFGITVGYHRLLAHRSFAANRWTTRCLALAGCLAMQGGPLRWVADHREHHLYSDSDGDPHDIRRGLLYAHMLWIFRIYPKAYDDARIARLARDVGQDPWLRWLERHHYLPGLALGGVVLLAGGLAVFLWAFCARLVLLYHSTWLVNSAAHRFGYRNFGDATGTNNWLVALLAFGEGWHNNHHAWPSSARQGLKRWEVDPSWVLIRLLARVGLARDLMTVELRAEDPRGGALVRLPGGLRPPA